MSSCASGARRELQRLRLRGLCRLERLEAFVLLGLRRDLLRQAVQLGRFLIAQPTFGLIAIDEGFHLRRLRTQVGLQITDLLGKGIAHSSGALMRLTIDGSRYAG